MNRLCTAAAYAAGECLSPMQYCLGMAATMQSDGCDGERVRLTEAVPIALWTLFIIYIKSIVYDWRSSTYADI